MKLPQLAGAALAGALVVAGKHYIRGAVADDVDWLLAPTATLVSAVTGTSFVAAPGVGYIDRDVSFAIAPVCAGLHFLLAAFVALALGGLARMRTWRAMAARLGIALAAAYIATIAINTVRIAVAIWLHARQLGGDDLHRFEGVIVYLGGLCALYAVSQRVDRVLEQRADRAPRADRAAAWRPRHA